MNTTSRPKEGTNGETGPLVRCVDEGPAVGVSLWEEHGTVVRADATQFYI